MNRKYQIILIVAGVALAAVIVAATVLGLQMKSTAEYNDAIQLADQYRDAGDYMNATKKYIEAIDIKKNEPEAYIKLANTYVEAGYDDYAADYISRAYELFPDNEEVKALYIALVPDGKDDLASALNKDFLNQFGSRSYSDYKRTGGIASTHQSGDGSVEIIPKGVGAKLVFRSSDAQPNAVINGVPGDNSLPSEVHLDNVMVMFGDKSELSYNDLEAMDLKDLTIETDSIYGDAVSFTVEMDKALYKCLIESDAAGKITSSSDNTITIPFPKNRMGEAVEVTGVVRNAVDNEPFETEINLVFRKEGSDDVSAVTNSSGEYTAVLERGEYTVECSGEGVVPETQSIFISAYDAKPQCDIILSPDDGEVRIVLTWNASPADLDSHLIGSGIHVWFRNMNTSKADLDIDTMTGYGPETITIKEQGGKYTYVVHDYSQSGNLYGSGATVTVYIPGKTPRTFTISDPGDGSDTWVVFELDGYNINEINEIREFDLG